MLYLKENSPQTSTHSYTPLWNPYRVHGGAPYPCSVTSDNLLSNWRERRPLTIIARTNCELLLKCLGLLGINMQEESVKDIKPESVCSNQSNLELISSSLQRNEVKLSFPKIHINGQGENSGIRKWQKVLKLIEYV